MEDRIISRQFRSDDTSPWPFGLGNRQDGNVTISATQDLAHIRALTSGTATLGAYTIAATNASFAAGQIVKIIQQRGPTSTDTYNWEYNKISSYVAGTVTLLLPLQKAYVSDGGNSIAQIIVMPQYGDVTINTSVLLRAEQWDPSTGGGFLGFFHNGTLTINGQIYGTGRGFVGGQSANTGTPSQGQCGEGTAGPRASQQAANGNGGGGGRKTVTGAGINSGGAGAGGNLTSGLSGYNLSGASTGGVGGSSSSSADCTTQTMGGAGGCGAENSDSVADTNPGGNGGAIIDIVGRKLVVASANRIVSDGQSSPGGGDSNQDSDGGPGAPGSILIKEQIVEGFAAAISTQAGAGSSTTIGPSRTSGTGPSHIDYLVSVTPGVTIGSPNSDIRQDFSLRNKRAMVSSFML